MAQAPTMSRTYPWNTSLGGVQLTFRLMTPEDEELVLGFARTLSEEDLMFLRTDITQPATVKNWMKYLNNGRSMSVVAVTPEGNMAGYATVHMNEANWTRHVGELRVLVGPDYRGIGLGKRLTNEAFAMAKDLGLKKITAQMSTDQRSARGVFEHLGFRPEALLADHVMSRDGRTHDLLIMSFDVAGFSNEAAQTRRPR
jgi:L-amino acid N-acyltransferase YncA